MFSIIFLAYFLGGAVEGSGVERKEILHDCKDRNIFMVH